VSNQADASPTCLPPGFIALVVCLALVIIVSCTAVFFLVRNQKAYDHEQGRRRPYHRTSGRNPSSYLYNDDRAPKTWHMRLATLFGRRGANESIRVRSDPSRVKTKGTQPHGWVQAGVEDDYEVDLEERRLAAQSGVRQVYAQSPSSVISAPSIIRPVGVSRSNSDSNSSVHFDLGPVRGLGNYDRHPSPHPTLPNIHSQLSSPSSSPAPSPMRIRSPEPVAGDSTPDIRPQLSSSQSVRTFSGGSKFIESL
jgi:hypothetical protein